MTAFPDVRAALLVPVMAGLVCVDTASSQHPAVPGVERIRGVAADADAGRLLLAELNCTLCHAHSGVNAKGAPILDGVGDRLQAEWLRAYLTDPRKMHPGTTMPDVLAAGDRSGTVDALVHFLAAQKDGAALPRLEKHSSPDTGAALFKRIGCAACHAGPVHGQHSRRQVAAGVSSLAHLPAKYSHLALTEFLHAPLARRPGGRMPDMRLTLREAGDIAACLLDTQNIVENAERAPLAPFVVDARKALEGKRVFSGAGCSSCHHLEQVAPAMTPAPALQELQGKRADCSHADYGLSEWQESALEAALSRPIHKRDAAGRVLETLAALDCCACHSRDGIGGPAPELAELFTGDDTLGDEGRFPPDLSGVGRKLREEWLTAVLAGTTATRPYMHTRMPVFGDANVAHLAADFGAADAARAPEKAIPFPTDGDAEAGRLLMGTEGGVGCITCHGVGGRQGLAMNALSLDGATRRYLPEWFQSTLIDPLGTRPGTLMPSFWPGGVAGNQRFLGGDTPGQIGAIWRYLEDSRPDRPLPPGFPDVERKAFEIVPDDRPVIQRTMMEGAGTHAIAVGFPEGVHFAFDADACRLAIVWKGRFLDAYNAWFSRMDPTAEPLGHTVKRLSGPFTPGLRFKGYTLDTAGVPTFRYTDGEAEVLDRIIPDNAGGFTRTITRHSETRTTSISW